MSIFSLMAGILFVGHSLVGERMPELVDAGLRAMGAPAPVEYHIINGAPLVWNWDHSADAGGVDGRVRLASGLISTLILTEAQPIADHVLHNDSPGLVARWADAALAANPKAEVWLYETWPTVPAGSLGGDAGEWRAKIAEDLPLWREAAGDRAQIIPAGQAMALLSERMEAGAVPGLTKLSEIFIDDIHPNGKGNYLIAMVHLAALTGRSPEGLPAKLLRIWPSRDSVLSEEQARAFQSIAWQVVQEFEQAEKAEAAAPEPAAPEPPAAPVPAEVAAEPAARPEPAASEPVVPAEAAAAPEAVVAEPVPAPPPAALPAFEKISNPALMLGLAGISDWSVQQPFLDVMKTARAWTGHLPGQWGGWEEADLELAGALDADGWPLRVPSEVTGITTLVLTDLPPDAGGVAGRYLVFWEGKGVLEIGGRATGQQMGEGRATFDFTPGEGAVILTIKASDPADPLRAIRMVREDRAALLAGGEIFNPDWLARIEGVKGLRFMDWLATNDSRLARLEHRPRVEDYSWGRMGVPIEVILALANRLKADPWINIPHAAEDALVRDWAEVMGKGLSPGLKLWVEYSNEVWNWQFAQAPWAEEQAMKRWGQEYAWLQFYALRAGEIMTIFSEEMGSPERLMRVVATQTGYLGLEEQILEAPRVMAEGLPAPATWFDAYAITGYFSGLLGAEDHKLPMLRDWLAQSRAAAEAAAVEQGLSGAAAEAHVQEHRFDLALELALRELKDGSVSGQPQDTLSTVRAEILPYHAAVAAKYGLTYAMYEGGTHVVGMGGAVNDEELTAFFTRLNYQDGMGALYGELLAAWKEVSDAPFNAFVDVSAPGRWGSWGALRHLGDDNARWRALIRGCDPC